MQLQLSVITDLLRQKLSPNVVITTIDNTTPSAIQLPSHHIAEACKCLFEDPQCYFDYLACITALDNRLQVGTIDIIYNLYSIPYNYQLMIQITVARNQADGSLPQVPSVSHIWEAANWHEREAYDLVGIDFMGHTDLRRILLPADWIGHPLREDYIQPTHYHSMPTT